MGNIDNEFAENNSFATILNNGNFLIPPEQREYVWRPENIEKLFDGLKNNYDESCEDKQNGEEEKREKYYLGAIHTYSEPNENQELFVIDGQQRFTSLFIILFSLFNYMEDCNDCKDYEHNIKRIKKTFEPMFVQGKTNRELRFQAYTDKGNEFLEDLYCNLFIYNEETKYEHITNMARNAEFIKKHITETFVNKDCKEVYYFILSILNHTQITHIHNPNKRYALRMFVTLNESGKKLSAIDLLRAEMFNDDKTETESVSHKWSNIFKNLNNDEKIYTDFLKYYLQSIFGVKNSKITDVSLFEYVVKTPQKDNSKLLQYFDNDNKRMLNDIERSSDLCKTLRNGYQRNPLHDLTLYGFGINNCWKNFSLVTPLLIAIRRSCPDGNLYKELCQSLRNYDVKSHIINRSENKTKYKIPKMEALRIKYISDIQKDKTLAAKNLIDEMNSVNDIFITVLNENMEFKNGNPTKYLLARIYHYMEKKAYGQSISVDKLMSKDYDIEHCLPQSKATKNKDDKKIQSKCYSLGNLLLLSRSENRSLQNKSFNEKQKRYIESTFLLSKTMSPIFFQDKENNNDKITRTIREYNISEPDGNETNRINERKALYIKILKEIFCDNKDVSDEGDVTE